MTAQPPPERKKPRDAGYWAQRVEKLEVSDVPAGATNLNVHGRREVGALQGFGRMWQKTYRVSLSSGITPEEAVRVWKEEFPELQPPQSRFYPSLSGVSPGEMLLISATVGGMPVYTGVRVIYADDTSFTVMTPEGHPESGWNTFSAHEESGETVAQIQSLCRANDPVYELGFRIIGSTEQERIWTHVLKSLAARLGSNAPVELERVCVDSKVQWSQAKNLWHNAGARSALYAATAPVRHLRAALGSRSS